VTAAAERRISAAAARLNRALVETCGLQLERDWLVSALTDALSPCKCDPPGSDEEFCSGECYDPR
jgi:hypothetical protein